jgi:hypothetical protein
LAICFGESHHILEFLIIYTCDILIILTYLTVCSIFMYQSHFVVDPKSRKNTLQSIGTKWKNFKHYLYKKFIKPRKDLPSAELNTPPDMYPHLKKDWKLFVSKRTNKKWEVRYTFRPHLHSVFIKFFRTYIYFNVSNVG